MLRWYGSAIGSSVHFAISVCRDLIKMPTNHRHQHEHIDCVMCVCAQATDLFEK